MCLIAHVASRAEAVEVPWNEQEPGFHVEPLADYYRPVASVFRNQNIVYVGSHEGCGCGFRNVWGALGPDERATTPAQFRGNEPEPEAVTRSTASLVAFIKELAREAGVVEVYAFWDGDQSLPPIDTATVPLAALRAESFFLLERRLYIVEGRAA